MRRKILAGLAVAGMLLVPGQALAATGSDTATLSVTINTNISVTFTDDVSDFGAQNAGTTTTLLDSLAYTVDTNSVNGFELDVFQVQARNGPVFRISKDQFATAGAAATGGAGAQVADNWRTQNAAGSFSYLDSTRVVSNPTDSGAYSMTLNYVATTV